MIYKKPIKIPHIHFVKDDCRNLFSEISKMEKVVVVTDPPFNIGYHYNTYMDKMDESEYYSMLTEIVQTFPSVIIHYPEQLHRLTLESGIVPKRVVSWVYNSNTAKQHRDIAFYGIVPDFNNVRQPYKNQNDKRILERMQNGSGGGKKL